MTLTKPTLVLDEGRARRSCLTVNLSKEYVRLDGQRIPTIRGWAQGDAS